MAVRRTTIARAIFLLVAAAIVLATIATFAITFAGPPPRERPVSERDIASALTGRPIAGLQSTMAVVAPRRGERRQPERDQRLAALLGEGTVTGFYEGSEAVKGEVRGSFSVTWSSPYGQRSVQNAGKAVVTHWLVFTIGSMAAALLVMLIPVWLIARAISRPLQNLAASARHARMGESLAVPESGSVEVQDLGAALVAMHKRIAAAVEGRTAMLAAIAHDLGTPLSRLAFYVDALPEPARSKANQDLDEMREMIGAAISFARDEAHSQIMHRLDLGSLLDSLVEDMLAAKQPVRLTTGHRAIVNGDPLALRRLFANLIDNAIAYGSEANVSWHTEPDRVVVIVRDKGPSIDPLMAERLFEPFVRGEPSRNRKTGGTGLGLAIVRSVAARHGGEVTLAPGAEGTAATVVLPLVAAPLQSGIKAKFSRYAAGSSAHHVQGS